jgi:hypothetical protein
MPHVCNEFGTAVARRLKHVLKSALHVTLPAPHLTHHIAKTGHTLSNQETQY